MKKFYEEMKARLASSPKTSKDLTRWTQPLAVNLLANRLRVDSVRAAYFTRESLTPEGNISIDSPIVICVRSKEKILSMQLELPFNTAETPQ